MKYCPNCNAEVADNAVACPQCGYNFGPAPAAAPAAPAIQLKTNRGLLKLILLSIITLGIYGIVVMSGVSEAINIAASKYDGKKTMHYCLLLFIVAPFTLGIGALVWNHKLSNRLGAELQRRGIDYKISAGTFWGWGFAGILLFGIGPLVYTHKVLKATNLICADYNVKG